MAEIVQHNVLRGVNPDKIDVCEEQLDKFARSSGKLESSLSKFAKLLNSRQSSDLAISTNIRSHYSCVYSYYSMSYAGSICSHDFPVHCRCYL